MSAVPRLSRYRRRDAGGGRVNCPPRRLCSPTLNTVSWFDTPGRSVHLGGQLNYWQERSTTPHRSCGVVWRPAGARFPHNATLLRCAAPQRPPGRVTLQILVDGLVANTFDFTYVETATAYAVVPTIGPALGGGTIRLMGANFDISTKCCVNEVEVSTKYVSPTTLHCEAPMRTPQTVVQIHVCDDVARYDYEYFRPALAARCFT